MTLQTLFIFAATEFFLSMAPGPAVLVVVSQGMRYGLSASLNGTAGILTGNAVYFLLSALGLGAILIASASMFLAIKWVGAGYLVYLGLKMLWSRGKSAEVKDGPIAPAQRALRLFSQGLITQLSNPKAIIFFTALLPQFVSPGADLFTQLILLGVVSIAVEFPVLLVYGWLAERGKQFMAESKFSSLPARMAGAFLLIAGIRLVWTKRS